MAKLRHPTPQAPARPSHAGAKVIVASKLPMALDLQHCEMREVQRRLRETMWTELEAAKVGPIVRINGTAYPRGQAPEGFRAAPQMVAGYALTHGVDQDWWDAWEEVNRDAPFVKSGLIFAAETMDEIGQRARGEFKAVTSGLDPVSPPKDGAITDPRLPKPVKGLTLTGEAGPTDADMAAA